MEKTTLRSLFLLIIITGTIFTFTACGPDTKEVESVAPVQTVKEDEKKVEVEVKADAKVETKVEEKKAPVEEKKADSQKAPIEEKKADEQKAPVETKTETAIPVVQIQPEVKVTTKYADGTYIKSGSYNSPAGQESVTVTVSVKGDVVESVNVVSNASDPTSKNFQGLFISGINDRVVGKKLADVSVGVVNGSSLTGNGFNNAIAAVQSAAQK